MQFKGQPTGHLHSHFDNRSTFIGGHWSEGRGAQFSSYNPARDGEVVWTGGSASRQEIDAAVNAARTAQPSWAALSQSARNDALDRLSDVVSRRAEAVAQVITAEMGKPLRESLGEVKSLPGKVLASRLAQDRLPDLALPGAPGVARWRPHGVMAVVGPFNYPLHLIHTHVAPALLAGNAVVVKASEITPLSVRLYVEMLHEAGLPAGVVNLVQGGGDVGSALVAHEDVDAVAFTGSWATGRRIAEACLDRPGKLLALEMGGKNIAVVLEDANLEQALHEVVIGACLTAGQRCTATSRVLVHEAIAERFIDLLTEALDQVEPGDPLLDSTLMGPLATQAACDRFLKAMDQSEGLGARWLVRPKAPGGGAFVSPAAHLCDSRAEAGARLCHQEFFAPHLSVEVVDSEDGALALANESRFGLSLSVFTASHARFERFTHSARAGVFNWNRSTNNATGLLPFGGLGWSGNHHPAGSAAALYCAYPTAVLQREWGAYDPDPRFAQVLAPLLAAAGSTHSRG